MALIKVSKQNLQEEKDRCFILALTSPFILFLTCYTGLLLTKTIERWYNEGEIINIFLNLKSVIAKGLLNRIQESAGYVPVYLNFSAQTSSARTQEIIESKLERKRKNILGKNYHFHLSHKLLS